MDKAALKRVIAKALSRIHLFSNVNRYVLDKIVDSGNLVAYKKGSTIVKEGDGGDGAFVIISGLVKICKEDHSGGNILLKTAHPGEVIGEMSLLDGLPRSADAVAVEDCVLFHIYRKDFMQLLRTNPDAALKLLETVSVKLRQTNEMLFSVQGNKEVVQNGIPAHSVAAGNPEAAPGPGGQSNGDVNGQQKQKSTGTEDDPRVEHLYSKKFTCPLCSGQTHSMVARSKYVQVEKIDPDMCTYYRLVNPTFYYVIVCHRCGYSFIEDSTTRLIPGVAAELQQKLASIKPAIDFSGPRDIDTAIEAYKLAILCQSSVRAKHSLLGRLYLRLGCLYRQRGLEVEETQCLEKSLEHLQQAFSGERSSDTAAELNLIYLIGSLNEKLGRLGDAVQWFSRVVNHPDRDSNPHVINMARERWQDIRYRNKKEKEFDT